jgi:hypothetical protein
LAASVLIFIMELFVSGFETAIFSFINSLLFALTCGAISVFIL